MKQTDVLWQAVLEREQNPIPPFFYGVKTTGIYCRPNCPSRRPKRQNAVFYSSCAQAEADGFRACLRCRPNQKSPQEQTAALISRACREIETAEVEPSLDDLARQSGLSPFHFQRTFKSAMGLTPKAYAQAHRMKRFRDIVGSGEGSITTAIYDAGYTSSSRFYEIATQALGMTPKLLRQGGKGVKILFAIGECSLGSVLVASSAKGVCAMLLGDTPEMVLEDLQDRFPQADLIGNDPDYETLIAHAIRFVDDPKYGFNLPLDIQGTAFQQRVWEALRDIPIGTTASYSEIAVKIGAPKSFRAVAQACGANNIALAIPCHRVVRSDGGLSGYRWGVERKSAILDAERKAG
ncbi:bifunctional DNA-binding transcriptional regulator/O6-methylguanine-DNA methyltransferase Ada [Epibacterium ulvae]|uniref:bifunctional DNA-binding transcriptional regulator/O6-methylguanine-DNA methyltransferase Ada n=1 Tax=Epibacterium ulvae TaxID=1156985 RepID=UPI0024920D7F|nr:bifunctional DNA-binding transcriptional regulator/O6-methylguanine-DNA methyltransferase Ada [Epibacterium ulvae]